MSLSTYNADKVSLIFNGIIIEGLADGSFVTVEQNEDAYSLQVGTDGDACRSQSNNYSGRITFTLGQWSVSNDLLSAMHNADLLTGVAIGPLLVKDNSGTSLHVAEKAWIVRMPAGSFEREAVTREWIIETDRLIQHHGSN